MQAKTAVGNWLRREAAPFETKLGSSAHKVVTHRNARGEPLFHSVELEGEGFVVTSADNAIQPIIAFSEGHHLVADATNPLWALLNKDMTQRRDALRTRKPLAYAGILSSLLLNLPDYNSPEAQWADLLNDKQITPLGLASISDVRILPIVQSHWGQSTVAGFWGSYNCYNYYTPNHYVCGCVATAMAQIMRKHCYPVTAVEARSFQCSVDGVRQFLTMKGGIYNWSNMRLKPDEGFDMAPIEAIREAIGKLCYDTGVSVGMMYASDASGAYSAKVPYALTDVFGYASAYLIGPYYWGVSEDEIQNAILVNLDHGYPVYLGISGSPGGHAVVADGYGFNSETRYIHLNMGWNGGGNGGYQNAWYNVPTVDTSAAGTYTSLDEIVYNIIPDIEKKLVSGRVLSSSGAPVANATVYVTDLKTDSLKIALQTNSKGMYTFSWDGYEDWEDWQDRADICASDGTYASTLTTVSVTLGDNAWGIDLYLKEPSTKAVLLDANGGAWGSSYAIVTIGSAFPYGKMAPTRDGFKFMGFFDTLKATGGTQYYSAYMNPTRLWCDVSVTTLYARWEAIAVQIGGTIIPHIWFNSFGISSGYDVAAISDLDHDGTLTWQEYIAGTDPTNSLSVFRITKGLHPDLTWWPNLPDRIYTIMGKTNLADTGESWTAPTNTGHRFFRVRVELP